MFRNPRVELVEPVLPTYTFPFATLGTLNFTAIPEGTSDDTAFRVHVFVPTL